MTNNTKDIIRYLRTKFVPEKFVAANANFISQLQTIKMEFFEKQKHCLAIDGFIDQFIAFILRRSKSTNPETLKREMLDALDSYEKKLQDASWEITQNVIKEQLIRNGDKVLTYGFSNTVNAVLQKLRERKINFELILVQSAILNRDPDVQLEQQIDFFNSIMGKNPLIVSEGGVLSIASEVDVFLVGAEGVTQNGGVINTIGTQQLALVAQLLKKRFVVACQQCKILRQFYFTDKEYYQKVVVKQRQNCEYAEQVPNANYLQKYLDFTPPEYVQTFATDSGVFTAVQLADEAARLFAEQ